MGGLEPRANIEDQGAELEAEKLLRSAVKRRSWTGYGDRRSAAGGRTFKKQGCSLLFFFKLFHLFGQRRK